MLDYAKGGAGNERGGDLQPFKPPIDQEAGVRAKRDPAGGQQATPEAGRKADERLKLDNEPSKGGETPSVY